MTPKQQAFVEEYLKDLNATQAAIRAGYSPKYADRQANQLLENTGVRAAIIAAKAERSERTKIDSDWVLVQLAEEKTADIADIYDDSGNILPVKQWPLVWRQGLVSGIDTATMGEETVVHKVKLADRTRIMELIGKHVDVGAFEEKMRVKRGIEDMSLDELIEYRDKLKAENDKKAGVS